MKGLIPFTAKNDFLTHTNRLFDDFYDEISSCFGLDIPIGIFDTNISKNAYPRVNIIDAGKNVIVEATVPGLTKEDISVEWCDNTLTISGGKEEKKELKEKDYKRREITKKRFSRSFSVYESLYDCYNIKAEVKDGLLTITLPKKVVEEKKPEIKKIEIK